ncbi:cupin domain-containing protein [Rhizobium sp. P38BS-XIX]|uniref:cupin domain-containing protein n=1 Tax=Rhizobium sp. P38BS-XIX TaxID=2726740 RepID=UPI00145792E3|nr:cupin domain-containing protein [Rhizobium sp. P38BS-XIX]NLS01620.1 cupin domain-containing protein [Rhizobium sp. P38BS-XIX]
MTTSWSGSGRWNVFANAKLRERPAKVGIAAAISLAVGAAILAIGFSHHTSGTDFTVAMEHHAGMHASETATPAEAGRPTTVVKPISCEKLPNVPGKSLTLALVDYPPDAYTPRHRHPGSVSAFVTKGTLRSQLAGGPVGTYSVGQTWFEPPGAVHLFAENASKTEPAQILAMFIADDNCGPLVIPD